MTMVFLSVRVLHILCAALWLGSVVFISLLLMPAIDELGPDGGKVMAVLGRKGLNAFMGAIGGLTVLTGIALYYHLTAGFDPTLSASHEAMVFGAGGVLGIAAAIIGGSVVGRSAKKMNEVGARLGSADATQRTALAAELATLRRRVVTFGHLVMALLILTLVLMSIGHYV